MIQENRENPILYIVSPCYFSHDVLPITGKLYLEKLMQLIHENKISDESRILWVNDGSTDDTWDMIQNFAKEDYHFKGINLSRNRGHQNALLCGLMEAKNYCDISISIDDDGQDDVNAMDKMVEEYKDGCEIVYGVRSNRDTDTAAKRDTAELYYKILAKMGVEVVYNHADYRLMSKRALEELSKYKEVNLYLRGLAPMIGFKTTTVEYARKERVGGEGHYTIGKLFHLALDGITSTTTKPVQFILEFGIFISFLSLLGIIYTLISKIMQPDIPAGWASMTCIICFVCGVQMISIGVIGEYVGKLYMESKHRPRYTIAETTYEEEQSSNHSK